MKRLLTTLLAAAAIILVGCECSVLFAVWLGL